MEKSAIHSWKNEDLMIQELVEDISKELLQMDLLNGLKGKINNVKQRRQQYFRLHFRLQLQYDFRQFVIYQHFL